MKPKSRLSILATSLVVALVAVLAMSFPAHATVEYTDSDGTTYTCRRVFFDNDANSWSDFCFRRVEDINYILYTRHVFRDSESSLVPVDEVFYLSVGYHVLTASAQGTITIADGSSATYDGVHKDSDGNIINTYYKVDPGSADVTVKTRSQLDGSYNTMGIYTPNQNNYPDLPRAYELKINADDGFAGLVNESNSDDASWIGYPINYWYGGSYHMCLWDGTWEKFGFGAKSGYDINGFTASNGVEVKWGGGEFLYIKLTTYGSITITTSDEGIERTGTNCFISAPMNQQNAYLLKGITVNMPEFDSETSGTIEQYCTAPVISGIAGMWSARYYDTKPESFLGECSLDFQKICSQEPYASVPLSVSVLSAGWVEDTGYVALVDKTDYAVRIVEGAVTELIGDYAYVTFDVTLGELVNSYVCAFVPIGAIHAAGWATTPSGAYVYYREDGTLLTDGWAKGMDGNWYYLGSDGILVWNGVCQYEGKYYWIANGKVQTNAAGWKLDHNSYYYFKNGVAVTDGWVKSGGYYYMGSDGKMLRNAWAYAGSTRYFMGNDGKLVYSGWAYVNGGYSYFNENGQMVTNAWVYYNRYYYLMDGYGHPIVNEKNHPWMGYHFNFDAYGRCTWSDLPA